MAESGDAKIGRPPEIRDAETREKLLVGYRLYGTHIAAAGYAGLARSSVERWRESDEAFAAQVEQARGEYVLRRQKQVEADETTATALRMMQIVGGKEYSPADRHEVSGDGLAIAVNLGVRHPAPQQPPQEDAAG